MTIRDRGMNKPNKLPRCIGCNSKNTVGRVVSVNPHSNTACKAYFCSNCLTEFREKDITQKKTPRTTIQKGQ